MNAEDIFRNSIGCEIMLMIKARIRLLFSRYTTTLKCVSLAGRWWPNIECWLGSFGIFQGGPEPLYPTLDLLMDQITLCNSESCSVHQVSVQGQNFLLASYCNFPESRKKKSKIVFLFHPLTLNIICFVEKNNIFFGFCLCIFENHTVKSDCTRVIQ